MRGDSYRCQNKKVAEKRKLSVDVLALNHEINRKIKYRKKMCFRSKQIWLN